MLLSDVRPVDVTLLVVRLSSSHATTDLTEDRENDPDDEKNHPNGRKNRDTRHQANDDQDDAQDDHVRPPCCSRIHDTKARKI